MADVLMPNELNYCLTHGPDEMANLEMYKLSAAAIKVLMERAVFFRPVVDPNHKPGDIPPTVAVYREPGVQGVVRGEEGSFVVQLRTREFYLEQLAWVEATLIATDIARARSEHHLRPA
jgi:hypothetical protein